MELSVLIPARSEEFLARTIQDILDHSEADTEVIAVCDGGWPPVEVPDHPRVTLIYHPKAIGQRAATNEAARLSRAKFVMKCDAHCSFDQGFDRKLMADYEPGWTVIPRLYNLHAFDRVCECGHRVYQGPQIDCEKCGKPMKREIIWKPRWRRTSDFQRFDHELHFQYWGAYKKRAEVQGDLAESMSFLGACFFMSRDRFIEIEGLDEKHGSWGQFGTEIACKTWLSGGRLMVNKKTFYSHLFRTQDGFSFPYPNPGTHRSRQHSQWLWYGNNWPKQIYPLSWLIEKFWPIPDWSDPVGAEVLAKVKAEGVKFDLQGRGKGKSIPEVKSEPEQAAKPPLHGNNGHFSASLLYYTDNHADAKILAACQRQLQKCSEAYKFPIISVSQEPLDFGKNIYVGSLERCALSMCKQVLKGLEAADTDWIYLCEHDLLYHPAHFVYRPERTDTYYYDQNQWNVHYETGKAVFYLSDDTSMLLAPRQLLLDHFRVRIKFLEEEGFRSSLGWSPPKGIPKEMRTGRVERYMAEYPCIDIRHGGTLTRVRMDKSQFRKEPKDWKEAEEVPGWGRTYGCFDRLLEVRA